MKSTKSVFKGLPLLVILLVMVSAGALAYTQYVLNIDQSKVKVVLSNNLVLYDQDNKQVTTLDFGNIHIGTENVTQVYQLKNIGSTNTTVTWSTTCTTQVPWLIEMCETDTGADAFIQGVGKLVPAGASVPVVFRISAEPISYFDGVIHPLPTDTSVLEWTETFVAEG